MRSLGWLRPAGCGVVVPASPLMTSSGPSLNSESWLVLSHNEVQRCCRAAIVNRLFVQHLLSHGNTHKLLSPPAGHNSSQDSFSNRH